MALSDIVNVAISKQTTGISQIGFGTLIIMSSEAESASKFAETAKIYTSLAEFGTAGDNYDQNAPTYLKAQAIFSQNPNVSQIIVGRRTNLPLQTVNYVPVVADSTLYQVIINGETFGFTSDATATLTEIIDGLVALINAGTQNVFADNNTSVLRIQAADTPGGTPTAGPTYRYQVNSRTLLPAQNVTADPGIVADLSSVRTAVDGNDDWYTVVLDSCGLAEISALAANIEASGSPGKIFLASTSDADVLAAPTTDIGGVLAAANYTRTSLMWHEDPMNGPEAAWAGVALPNDAGSITWKFKTLAGQVVSALTPTETNNLDAKNVNRYVQITNDTASASTCNGTMASGEFMDITRGIDFITARMQERVFLLLKNAKKVPFTDAGIALVENEVRGVLNLGISQDIFTNDPAPTVTVPRANAVATNDRANRLLTPVKFRAQLAGAIHAVEITGIVTV